MTDAERSAAQIVVADASLLINLMHVDRLQLMTTGLGYQFVMPQEVDEEIKDPAQRAIVLAACKAGKLQIAELTDLAAITIFAHLTQRFWQGGVSLPSACRIEGLDHRDRRRTSVPPRNRSAHRRTSCSRNDRTVPDCDPRAVAFDPGS